MKTNRVLPLVIAMMLLSAINVLAGDVKIIANRSVGVDSLTAVGAPRGLSAG